MKAAAGHPAIKFSSFSSLVRGSNRPLFCPPILQYVQHPREHHIETAVKSILPISLPLHGQSWGAAASAFVSLGTYACAHGTYKRAHHLQYHTIAQTPNMAPPSTDVV